MRPFPRAIADPEKRAALWHEYRLAWISWAGIALFLFGNKRNDEGKVVDADGVVKEFELAQAIFGSADDEPIERQYPRRDSRRAFAKAVTESETVAMDKMPALYHELYLEHLVPMSIADFSKWLSTGERGALALDALYEFKQV